MTTTELPAFEAGTLVQARGREWVVLPQSQSPRFLVLRPLGGGDDEVAGVFPSLEQVSPATFEAPDPADAGTAVSAGLLRTALRIGFRASAGPFRSLARLAVEPRAYQLVPLLMALRQDTVRMLIADDVGIGKTVEAGLIATELLEQGDATGLAVLCGPALAEQWQRELSAKFASAPSWFCPARSGGWSAGSCRARRCSTGSGTSSCPPTSLNAPGCASSSGTAAPTC